MPQDFNIHDKELQKVADMIADCKTEKDFNDAEKVAKKYLTDLKKAGDNSDIIAQGASYFDKIFALKEI